MIQKLKPIHARAYARSKIAKQKEIANKHHTKFHDGQGASTNENDTNRAMGEGIAAGRVDFPTPQSLTTRTQLAKSAEG